MVFIYKAKDIIKIFNDSSFREIGISLLAYEQFICKGLKVSDKDLERLTKIFDYYDNNLSNDYPSLTNEVLQSCDTLINDYFKDTYKIIKDDYKIDTNLTGRYKDTSYYDIEILDKTGYLVNNFKLTISDERTKSNYDKDSFNATYNACKEVNKEMKNKDIESLVNTFKL